MIQTILGQLSRSATDLPMSCLIVRKKSIVVEWIRRALMTVCRWPVSSSFGRSAVPVLSVSKSRNALGDPQDSGLLTLSQLTFHGLVVRDLRAESREHVADGHQRSDDGLGPRLLDNFHLNYEVLACDLFTPTGILNVNA